MFVRSRLSKDIVYRKRGKSWVIKAGTVTYIDENQVTAKELRELYSTRIEIISMDKLENMEIEIPVKEEVKKEEIKKVQIEKSKPIISNTKPVVTKKHKEDDVIDRLLAEIKDEVKDEPIIKVKDDSVKEGFMTGVGSIVPETEVPIITVTKDESSVEIKKPLKVTTDEIGDLVLEPVHAVIEQPVEIKEESTHAGADLKIELDAVQPVETKKEEPVTEDKPKRGRKAKVSSVKKTSGKKRGRKKSTAK